MKSILITGATRGIGLALARFYADKGCCLTLNGGHDKDALAAVEKESFPALALSLKRKQPSQ